MVIQRDASLLKSLPELIDRETVVREVLEILENIIAEGGDLIERRPGPRRPSTLRR